MHDLLTEKEDAAAAAEGWMLSRIYDLITKKWGVGVLPFRYGAPFSHAEAAGSHVVAHARLGVPLHLRALQLIMQGHSQGKK